MNSFRGPHWRQGAQFRGRVQGPRERWWRLKLSWWPSGWKEEEDAETQGGGRGRESEDLSFPTPRCFSVLSLRPLEYSHPIGLQPQIPQTPCPCYEHQRAATPSCEVLPSPCAVWATSDAVSQVLLCDILHLAPRKPRSHPTSLTGCFSPAAFSSLPLLDVRTPLHS